MSKKFFCLPGNWIYLPHNYFSSYVYLKDTYKTLKGIGKIQFVSELTILLYLSKQESSQRKKSKLLKLEYCSLCGKDNFSVIHPTHITIYSC